MSVFSQIMDPPTSLRLSQGQTCDATYWCMKQLNSTQHNHMLKLIRIIIHPLRKSIWKNFFYEGSKINTVEEIYIVV